MRKIIIMVLMVVLFGCGLSAVANSKIDPRTFYDVDCEYLKDSVVYTLYIKKDNNKAYDRATIDIKYIDSSYNDAGTKTYEMIKLDEETFIITLSNTNNSQLLFAGFRAYKGELWVDVDMELRGE